MSSISLTALCLARRSLSAVHSAGRWKSSPCSVLYSRLAAYVAVSSSNVVSWTPLVFTFSKTVHTASFGVALLSRMTGIW